MCAKWLEGKKDAVGVKKCSGEEGMEGFDMEERIRGMWRRVKKDGKGI